MTLEHIYFLSGIIAAIAMVISLIYLGVQIRNTRIQTKSHAFDFIATQRGQFTNLLATDRDLSLIVAKGLAGKDRLSPNDYFRFTCYLYNLSINLELAFKKWKKRDLDNDSWNAWHEASQFWFSCPGAQRWWMNNQIGGFTSEYKHYVNECMQQLNVSNPKVTRIISHLEQAGKSFDDNFNSGME